MKDLKLVVKECFENMYVVARFDAKKNFKSIKKNGDKWDMARALVFLNNVAKNPDKYFSVESTNGAWDARVDKYISQHDFANDINKWGLGYVRGLVKGCIVESPALIVHRNVKPVVSDSNLWSFCGVVQNLYYSQIQPTTYVDKQFLIDYAKKMADLAKIAKQKNPVKRKVMELINTNAR